MIRSAADFTRASTYPQLKLKSLHLLNLSVERGGPNEL